MTITMGNCPGQMEGIHQGFTILCLGVDILGEEKTRGLNHTGHKRLPLQPIKHGPNTGRDISALLHAS